MKRCTWAVLNKPLYPATFVVMDATAGAAQHMIHPVLFVANKSGRGDSHLSSSEQS